ncbi:MAG: NAD-dependent deacylase [Candidatus Lokiarchaeota archaeon]|nr:NAD-dependent deacylase [Candidatus Lokiarchaeota archaeon]
MLDLKDRIKIQKISTYLLDSSNAIALTGAGISTNSGIPHFRGKGGIWDIYKPEIYGNIEAYQKNPEKFWKMAEKIAPKLFSAKPNPGHYALAELEKMNIIKGIITQNIDQLHHKAGSIIVYEVHGNINHFICLNCKKTYSKKEISKIKKKNLLIPPRCKICQSPLKPSVILFGETLPSFEYFKSKELVAKADILLVAGSSLSVNPIATFPLHTLKNGGKLIIINDEPTYLDDKADIVIINKTEIILPLILEQIKKERFK